MTISDSATACVAKVQKPVDKKVLHQAAVNMSQSDKVKSILAKMEAKTCSCDCC